MNIDWSKAPKGAASLVYSETLSFVRFRSPAGGYWIDGEWQVSPFKDWQTIATRPEEQSNEIPQLIDGDIAINKATSRIWFCGKWLSSEGIDRDDFRIEEADEIHRAGQLIWQRKEPISEEAASAVIKAFNDYGKEEAIEFAIQWLCGRCQP